VSRDGFEEKNGAADFEPGWRERIWTIGSAAGRLLETRFAIFQEELSAKGVALGRGLAGLFLALLFAVLAGLLLTALLAAVFAKLFGSAVLGILATFVLYLAVAGVAGWLGVRALSKMRPFEFPETRREVDRDLDAIKRAAGVGQRRGPDETEPEEPRLPPDRGSTEESAIEMEARLREGAG
jgi:uncharacterized membrane protein YqjE